MHALAVTANRGIQLAVQKQNVQDHSLHALLVIEGLVRQTAHILQNLGADRVVLAHGVPGRVRVVGEGVHGQGSELFRVPDEAQVLLAVGGVRSARLAGQNRPLLGGRGPPEQEGLPADGAQTGCAGVAVGPVELEGALQIGYASAVSEGRLPS